MDDVMKLIEHADMTGRALPHHQVRRIRVALSEARAEAERMRAYSDVDTDTAVQMATENARLRAALEECKGESYLGSLVHGNPAQALMNVNRIARQALSPTPEEDHEPAGS